MSLYKLAEKIANKYGMDEDGNYLYHVTYYNRLTSIAESGLQPNQGRSIGGEAYTGYARGKIFLSDKAGVQFWASRAEAFAEHNSDNIYEDQLVPVVLRVDIDECRDLMPDNVGSQDSYANAWMSVYGIPPEVIEVWNGLEWIDIADYDSIDFEQALYSEEDPDFDPESEDYYDEDKRLMWFFKSTSPLTSI